MRTSAVFLDCATSSVIARTALLSASFKGVLMEEAEARQSQTASFTFQRKPGEWQWK
jgi:hypothetical protein